MSYSDPLRSCSDASNAEYLAFCEAELAEIEAEMRAADPVRDRYELVSFVSKSKGRGRKRAKWQEVYLVNDKHAKRCTLWNKYPFDVYASEMIPGMAKDDVEQELQRRIALCQK